MPSGTRTYAEDVIRELDRACTNYIVMMNQIMTDLSQVTVSRIQQAFDAVDPALTADASEEDLRGLLVQDNTTVHVAVKVALTLSKEAANFFNKLSATFPQEDRAAHADHIKQLQHAVGMGNDIVVSLGAVEGLLDGKLEDIVYNF